MASRDKLTNTTQSERNARLRMVCSLGGFAMAFLAYKLFKSGDILNGAWAAFVTLIMWAVAAYVQVVWKTKVSV